MQATIEIDAQILQKAEALARREGKPFSTLVEQSLLKTLEADVGKPRGPELYGEPLTDEDIDDSARVTFQMLDDDENRAQTR